MLLPILKTQFAVNLDRLKTEIDQYQDEERLWYVEGEILNSGGNLCLHLIGNLNAFIGAELGNSGYIRDREAEFSSKGIPKAVLLKSVEDTKMVLMKTLDAITEAQLQAEYPIQVLAEKTSTGYFLTHLATHLSYHVGQINYHRRFLDK